jgi:hypothetical protein
MADIFFGVVLAVLFLGRLASRPVYPKTQESEGCLIKFLIVMGVFGFWLVMARMFA